MDKDKFIDLVKRMREAQREFFKTRSKQMLIRSKNLESVVDVMIKEHDEWQKLHPKQHDLFEKQ